MAASTQKRNSGVCTLAGFTGTFADGYAVSIIGKRKRIFSFEYADEWLKSGFSQMIDPDLQLYSGAYYQRDDKPNFGVFLDSCPDRWGRVLMQRREAAIAKQEDRAAKNYWNQIFYWVYMIRTGWVHCVLI
jgi:serine/threonine-protein kinase HipA